MQFYSLKIRGILNKPSNLRTKILQSSLILKSLFNRFFFDIGKITFAGESHFIENSNNYSCNPYVELKNVSVFYDNEEDLILENINLVINKKTFLLIAGENKSGKTTLLRVIGGYIPTIMGNLYGEVSICGTDFSEKLEIRDISKCVKYIMDDPDDYIFGLTVGQEIMLHTNKFEDAKQCLKLMKIDQLWDRETTTLSGGEKVRLVLASLLASKAKIILLDSVLSQLDENGRIEFLEALKTFYDNNNCIVIVSDYHIKYYMNLVTRYVKLKKGKIECDKEIISSKSYKFQEKNHKLQFDTIEILNSNKLSNKNSVVQELIKLENVSVEINNKTILKNFSISIISSDFKLIKGPNGIGKTTAMLVLVGIISPSSGKRIIIKNPLNFGYIFQNTSLQIVGTTVEEELKIGPLLRNFDEQKIKQFVDDKKRYIPVELNNSTLTLHPVDMKFLAYAASDLEIDIIIFDEPTTYMDNKDLNYFLKIIENLRQNKVAVIIVSHDKRILNTFQ